MRDLNEPLKNSFRRASLLKMSHNHLQIGRVSSRPLPITAMDLAVRRSLLLVLLQTLSMTELLAMMNFVMSNIDQKDIVMIIGKLIKRMPDGECYSVLRSLMKTVLEPKIVKVVENLFNVIQPNVYSTTLMRVLDIIRKTDVVKILCEILKSFPALVTIFMLHKFLIAMPEHDPIVSANKILAHTTPTINAGVNFKAPEVIKNVYIPTRTPLLADIPARMPEEADIPKRRPLTSSPKPYVAQQYLIPKLDCTFSDEDCQSIHVSFKSDNVTEKCCCKYETERNESETSFDSALVLTFCSVEKNVSNGDSDYCSSQNSSNDQYVDPKIELKFKRLVAKMDRLDNLLKEIEKQMCED